MANTFVYRGDPPCQLTADGGLAGPERAVALMRQQIELGVSVGSSGRLWSTADLAADLEAGAVEAGFAAIRAELAAMVATPASLPPKVGLPGPALAGLSDVSAFAAGLVGLVDVGARYLQFDGAGYATADKLNALASDVALLAELPQVEGLVTGIDLGAAAALGGKAEAVLSTVTTRRVTLSFGPDDDFDLLNFVPDEVIVVLGLVEPGGNDSNDAILNRIDAAAEVIDGDRLALTTTRGFADGEAAAQAAKLGQIADVNTMFWGFAM